MSLQAHIAARRLGRNVVCVLQASGICAVLSTLHLIFRSHLIGITFIIAPQSEAERFATR